MIMINVKIDSDQLWGPFNMGPIDKPDLTKSSLRETIRIRKTETT